MNNSEERQRQKAGQSAGAPAANDPQAMLKDASEHLHGGRPDEAARIYERVLSAQPDNAQAHNHHGMAKANQGKLDEAIACYRRALEIDPRYAEAYNNLGNVLRFQGKLKRAAACYQRVVDINPDYAAAHNNLGMALKGRDKTVEAIASFRRALELEPDNAKAHKNLGDGLKDQGKPDDALACYRRALEIDPDNPELHNSIGVVLEERGKTDEASAWYQHALDINPDRPSAHTNLGVIRYDQGRLDEAMACYRRALDIDPDHAGAHNNLGNAFLRLAKPDAAIACYRRAMEIDPAYVDAHFNRAVALLTIGDFETGWVEHEWRWKRERHAAQRRDFAQPLWDGSPLDGKTIFLYGEQGLGDIIQFIRYVPLVAERGGRVAVECNEKLKPLFHDVPGIDELIARGGEVPPFDVHAPLMTLPLICGTTLETIPGGAGYIRADSRLVEAWRDRLAGFTGRKVGLCWQGNPRFPGDRWRSIPLRYFAPLLDDPSSTFINLHKGPGEAQIEECGLAERIVNFSPQVDSFDDTAAIMENLDLIITSDTSIAHLAGALGRPVWVVLQFAPDWRWMLERDDSPWYPTMRLFRQKTRGDWEDALVRVKQALEELPAP